MNTKPSINVEHLIRDFYVKLIAAHDPFEPQSDYQYYELEDGAALQLEALEQMLRTSNYTPEVMKAVDAIVGGASLTTEILTDIQHRTLMEGVVRAQIELVHYAAMKRDSLLRQYVPQFEIFKDAHVKLVAINQQSVNPDASLQNYISKYYESEKDGWTVQTFKEKVTPLRWFTEHVGEDTNVKHITSQHMLDFRAAMVRIGKHAKPGTLLVDAQTENEQEQIHAKTAKKKFDTVKAFLRWLEAIEAIQTVPANKLTIKIPKTAKSKERRPFSSEELNLLFSSPIYTGCETLKHRYKSGKLVKLDDEYWLPLVLAYTGMRLNEPIQIPLIDVVVDGPHPHFILDTDKINLKTSSADRLVPIHPDLIEFGFLKFVKSKLKLKGDGRLFSDIRLGNYYSKKIGTYLDKIGLDDPLVVAHSWRHGFKDAMRNAKIPEGEQNFIMGHHDSSAAHNYGTGSNIDVLWGWVASVDLKLSESLKQRLTNNSKKM